MNSAVRRILDALAANGLRSDRGGNWQCPAHDDRNPSLRVTAGSGKALVYCHAGCATDEVLSALGLRAKDLFDDAPDSAQPERIDRRTVVERYVYEDEKGQPLFRVVRTEPKGFYQERWENGRWWRGLGETRRVPYRLPEVLRARRAGDTIYVCEGEKDVETVRSLACVGTCNPMGAGKWRDEFAEYFAGANLIIVQDRDEPGREHARMVFESLEPIAASVRIVEPAEGKDLTDHVEAGRALHELAPVSPAEPRSASDTNTEASTSKRTPGVNTSQLAERIKVENHIKLSETGRLYRYKNGVYRPDGERFCAVRTRELLGNQFKARHVQEALVWLRAHEPEISECEPRDRLNVANGLLDWRKGVLEPHSPTHVSTTRLPVAWNPTAKCPAIDEFLVQVLPSDAIDLFLEVAAQAVFPSNEFQRAVMFLGRGGNGKSQALNLLTALLGAENVSSVSLHSLAENRFAAAELEGRLANICGDLDARGIKRADLFKQITGGDRILGERKNQALFSFTSMATPIFSANRPPPSWDQSEAYFQRWVLIPFPNQFRGTEREDPRLIERLTTPAELEGLLVQVVAALRRLMARRSFDIPASSAAAANQYREDLDSVYGFVNDRCRFVDVNASFIKRPEVYRHYKEYCEAEHRHCLKAPNFYARLREDHSNRLQEKKIRGAWGFSGLALVASEAADDGATCPKAWTR